MSIETAFRVTPFAVVAALAVMCPSLIAQDAELLRLVKQNDDSLRGNLGRQVTDPDSQWLGGIADGRGLYNPYTLGGFLKSAAAAYYHPESAFHRNRNAFEGMKLGVGFLIRHQSEDGNINLLSTNFNSPPDSGFVIHNIGTGARLAQINDDKEVLSVFEPFLRRAGDGLAKGGVHTPNHRWVVCAALAQINELFPDEKYVNRIDQWLAEGVDIDEYGQFTERSTAVYNSVCVNSLVTMAHKLQRPELLDPVRRNLDAMAYLLHPGGEVVTEVSRRQDLNSRDTMRRYCFALRYMAIKDGNGLFSSMLAPHEPGAIDLAKMMEYPELNAALPSPEPIPDEYEKDYPRYGITRIRRGATSAVIMHKGSSRWITMRRGGAVINAVRFSSAFFGKGQFVPTIYEKTDEMHLFRQQLDARYYQPIRKKVDTNSWSIMRLMRDKSERCRMNYEGRVREMENGFEVSISAEGTGGVPLAVEINLRGGGEIEGVDRCPGTRDALLLKDGFAIYRMGEDAIRFGPGHNEHAYVQIRGAHGKMLGPSVYITGYTPFKHTLQFEMR
jgi:hypothetical protein